MLRPAAARARPRSATSTDRTLVERMSRGDEAAFRDLLARYRSTTYATASAALPDPEQADALFRDPYARKLAGERGERTLASLPKGLAWAWPMIVRTAVLDELILRTIERDRVDTVLNLAAGLDARPHRLPLPSTLRWVEADFPDVIAYKQEQLEGEQPVCVL